MIPDEHKDEIISNGINFIRSITEAYGSEEGMKLWETIADTIDPDIKGKIFIAMITGEYEGTIILRRSDPNGNRVSMIKAIRSVAGIDFKEAKEAIDHIAEGKPVNITCDSKRRHLAVQELRSAGFYV